jgi:hypothetical protein
MIRPKVTSLKHYPSGSYVEAWIVSLNAEVAESKIRRGWWADDSLKAQFAVKPIDRDWDWNTIEIEWEGRLLASEKVAIVAGDDGAVQVAMMISTRPVASVLEPGKGALFVELLFTAPRNRKELRKDETPCLIGVGIELLTWGAWFSQPRARARRASPVRRQSRLPGLVREARFAKAQSGTSRV